MTEILTTQTSNFHDFYLTVSSESFPVLTKNQTGSKTMRFILVDQAYILKEYLQIGILGLIINTMEYRYPKDTVGSCKKCQET